MEANSTIVVLKMEFNDSIQPHRRSCTELMQPNVHDAYYPGKSAFSLPVYEANADKNRPMRCRTGLPALSDLQSPYSPQFRI
ncbi:hypothetical protein AWB82_01527 [Caballeronia glebae]|uniref:Uncharacterized protein n=1 Tax=Caballeronia glebae TaxID=1777143 RepID=A0A158A0P7_9BURK|nr:hypothetical protein AWB82_01527 [Caballeronia glebae]